ncbi:XVIPCD domain-containing protein [Variovorax sp. Sphag1AA]|uniref:XVIPCD domain-containing protein n=1 Tax=Variovorax sp. Sphag1AA TaxID=2587027 RepID=UPI0016103BD2|nr:XVIPCD domain-containing protein [Variovorax sp. Sphag1AA]MBB3179382.1 putative chitinase [Variovorax sp. Sphag1AA]
MTNAALTHALRGSFALSAVIALTACGTPPPSDFSGDWRPVNRYQQATAEIPLSPAYLFHATPIDGTLKTMLERWARDTDLELAYTKSSRQISSKVSSALREGPDALEAARLEALEGKPERLAELMYGGRMGNNDPGDGYKYRGRGYIQLTGKHGYTEAGKALALDLVDNPELAADPENASKIAVWYWNKRVHNVAPESVTGATRIINGGTNGLEDRKSRFVEWDSKLTPEVVARLRTAVGHEEVPDMLGEVGRSEEVHRKNANLKQGDRGTLVIDLQRQLNALGSTDKHGQPLTLDGHFGPTTHHALQSFQRDHGLAPDGVVGPKTLNAMRTPSHHENSDIAAAQINEAGHPGFTMFRQALAGVQQLDAQHGRASDLHSEQISACLAVKAWGEGMQRIDHVALGTDATRIFAAQGALNSPFKQVAGVTTMDAFNTSIAQSTQDWTVVTRQRSDQTSARTRDLQAQDQTRDIRTLAH